MHVIIVQDTEERTLEISSELHEFLNSNPNEKEFFDSLSFSHKREYVEWVSSAKKAETRKKRMLD